MKKVPLVILLFLLSCVFVLQLVSLAGAQTSEETNDAPVTVKIAVYIHAIDEKKRLADVSINAFIDNYPYDENYLFDENEIELQLTGGGYAQIKCTRGDQGTNGWSYGGGSNETVWLLEGEGQLFPFDAYNLRFTIYYVGRINSSNCIFAEENQRAFLSANYLGDLWKTQDGLLPIASLTDQEINFVLQRTDNVVMVAFLEFFVPPIACYYLLGSALILDPKKQLAERLRIYLSIFFFVPAFLIALQAFFPYRIMLSFPELLLVNLLVSTAILGVFSILGNKYEPSAGTVIDNPYTQTHFRRMDALGVCIALCLFVSIYWVTFSEKISPPLIILFSYLITPAYIFWIPLINTSRWKISRKLIYSLLLGIIPTTIMYLISFIFFSIFAYIIVFGSLFIGMIVGYYVRNFTRGAVLAVISVIIGIFLAGIIGGMLLSGVEGAFFWVQVFGIFGNLSAVYALMGGFFSGYLLWRKKKRD